MNCRQVRIPKRNGQFRTLYVPGAEWKSACLSLLPAIAAAATQADRHAVQHGFTAGRSPVTNARAHVGWEYTLKFDLKDFFDTVTRAHIAPLARLSDMALEYCFPDGAARQGLPTSPALANLAASRLDHAIVGLRRTGRFVNFTYTRYADDLTFSFNHPATGRMLLRQVPVLIASHGFTINPAKTRMQCARAGRRHITGVAVDGRLHAPRALKRRLRAARHQLANGLRPRHYRKLKARQIQLARQGRPLSLRALLVGGYAGLREWAKLTPPKPLPPSTSPQPSTHPMPTAVPPVLLPGNLGQRKLIP